MTWLLTSLGLGGGLLLAGLALVSHREGEGFARPVS